MAILPGANVRPARSPSNNRKNHMSSFERVSKQNPCTVCGKDSWCMIGEDDAMCMRVSSDKPFTMKNGDIGYFHPLGTKRVFTRERKQESPRPVIDWKAMMGRWEKENEHPNTPSVDGLARNLKVEGESINKMGVVWCHDHGAWAFPMRDGRVAVCGIRMRSTAGAKWSFYGSYQGVFMGRVPIQRRAFIPEGPTDSAALISMGLFPIGRPSCSGGATIIKENIYRLGIIEVVIIADNDDDQKTREGKKFNPGFDSARNMAGSLGVRNCVITLPTKDVREFYAQGGSYEDIQCLVEGVSWNY